MKKLDKLILKSFLGPFVLTFFVVVFILLTQFLLKYFEDFVGKDLGWQVFSQLIFYFSIAMTPVALPLAVLLSSLMTFGNLGEHFELTAVKSLGISLLRALRPIFIFVFFLSIAAFLSNNYIVPRANLKAYSLLYDMRQKKPSLDIKEGVFYNGIPGYSIKVNKKFPDGVTLKDLIIYDHTKNMGNTDVIFADSGKMYTIMNERYMLLEMYNGESYSESEPIGARVDRYRKRDISQFARTKFFKTKLVFDLSSFDMKRTREELFSSNKLMKNLTQLRNDLDSMARDVELAKLELYYSTSRYFNYHLKDLRAPDRLINLKREINYYENYYGEGPAYFSEPVVENKFLGETTPDVATVKEDTIINENINSVPEKIEEQSVVTKRQTMVLATRDSTIKPRQQLKVNKGESFTSGTILKRPPKVKLKIEENEAIDTLKVKEVLTDSLAIARVDSLMRSQYNIPRVFSHATSQARFVKNNVAVQVSKVDGIMKEYYKNDIERLKKYSMAVSCMIMFLIGAPLGAIIKKGGLGVPVIISILFFIIFYVIMIMGEKYAKEGILEAVYGVWAPNTILLPFGLFFLKQARKDARLLEADFYLVTINKIRRRFGKSKEEEIVLES
jgi:lipopolysaccharide export system permease protein